MGQEEVLDFLESQTGDDYYNSVQIRDGIFMMTGVKLNMSSITQSLRKLRQSGFIESKLILESSILPYNSYLYRKLN